MEMQTRCPDEHVQCGRESHDGQPNQADVHDPIQSKESIVAATTEVEGLFTFRLMARSLTATAE